MICVVLAAGYATRLYPLTRNFPKPLLKVGDKTVLDWLLEDACSTCPITSVVVVSNHRYVEHFESWKKTCKITCPVTVLDDGTTENENRLGAVMDIQKAIDELNLDDDLMVIAGDNVLEFSLGLFSDYFLRNATTCIMRYQFTCNSERCPYGVCDCDEDGLVLSMEEKPLHPKSNWAVPPFYIYRRSDIPMVGKAIESGCKTDAPGSFIQWLCEHTPVHAFPMPGRRYDIGNLQSYEDVQRAYQGITITK